MSKGYIQRCFEHVADELDLLDVFPVRVEVQDDEVRVELGLQQQTRDGLVLVDFCIEQLLVALDVVLERCEGGCFDCFRLLQSGVHFVEHQRRG